MNAWTCATVDRKGNLEMLKYLREKECPWDDRTCLEAKNCLLFFSPKFKII
jgi:hypothetical protein